MTKTLSKKSQVVYKKVKKKLTEQYTKNVYDNLYGTMLEKMLTITVVSCLSVMFTVLKTVVDWHDAVIIFNVFLPIITFYFIYECISLEEKDKF